MSPPLYNMEEQHLPWAQERIGVTFRSDAKTIGMERDGEIVAVVVFDSFSECDVCMHIASDGTRAWMNKALLVHAFVYPMVQLGLKRVTGLVPSKNQAALDFDEHLGFVREGYHPLAGPNGDDLISLGMLRKNCRFIPKEFRS
jgi:RimJ/RimL family protein N-acetyltransferase